MALSWRMEVSFIPVFLCVIVTGDNRVKRDPRGKERELMSPRSKVQKGCCLLYKGRGLNMCVCLACVQTAEGVFQAQSKLWRCICPCINRFHTIVTELIDEQDSDISSQVI